VLYRPVVKKDIQKHYGDELMPMQLRMFGEEIDGTMPAGHPGQSLRDMIAAHEDGTGVPYMIHMSISD